MPKKTRKMKQRAAMRRSVAAMPQSDVEEDESVAETTLTAPTRPVLSTSSRVTTPASYDYSHIYNDLKRIAIFATFFFTLLIVLSFVIK